MTDLSPAALGRAIHDKRRRLFPGVTDLHRLPAGLDTAAYLIDELMGARIAQGDYAHVTLMNHFTPNPDFAFIAEGIRKARQTTAFARPGAAPVTREVTAHTPIGTQIRLTDNADRLARAGIPLRYADGIGMITGHAGTGTNIRMTVDDRIWWAPMRDLTLLDAPPDDIADIALEWITGARVRMTRDADNTFDVGPDDLPAGATGTLDWIDNTYGPGWAVNWDDFDHYIVPTAYMELIP